MLLARVAPAPVPARRKTVALVIAAVADAIQLGLSPLFAEGALSPADDALDGIVALLLLLTLGLRWRIAFALLFELVPGVALCPSWTLFVATLPADASTPGAATDY